MSISRSPPQFALFVGHELSASWRATSAERTPTYVQVNGDGSHLGTTAIKFEFVPSTSGEVDHFHIRCCLNKKYLRRESQSSFLIAAEADEPIEDLANWSSTVFKVTDHSNSRYVYADLHHLQGNNARMLVDAERDGARRLFLRQPESGPVYNMGCISWETLVVLPRDVILKGDNGRYLRTDTTQNRFEFEATDPADPSAAHTINHRFDGAISISNNHSKRFLRIFGENVDSTASSTDPSIHFRAVTVDGNLIALRAPFINTVRFLQRNSDGNQLVAPRSTTRLIREVRITVEEQVLSREIFNVVFRIPEAMIQDQENIMVATGQVFNASDAPNHVDMRLAYSLQTTSSWNARIAGEFGVRSKVTSGIPFLKKLFRLEAEYEISANISGEYEWGETVEETTEVETSYAVEVPPRSTMTISITAFKATSDIPFSYTQRDTTLDGEVVTTRMHDGLYTGANCYDFQYQAIPSAIETKSLPPSSPLTMKSSNARRPNPKGPSTKV